MCKKRLNVIEWLYLKQKGNLVYYDQLTGLLNRNYYERVAKAECLSKEVYVTIIDIDFLKETNDKCGHIAGSKRLQNFSKMLSNAVNGKGTLMRIGGDEFLVIGETSIAGIMENVNERFSYGSYLKERYEDISSAIAKADKELYNMKNRHHEVTE